MCVVKKLHCLLMAMFSTLYLSVITHTAMQQIRVYIGGLLVTIYAYTTQSESSLKGMFQFLLKRAAEESSRVMHGQMPSLYLEYDKWL